MRYKAKVLKRKKNGDVSEWGVIEEASDEVIIRNLDSYRAAQDLADTRNEDLRRKLGYKT